MKKLALLIAISVATLVISSCSGGKKCPAYSEIEQTDDIPKA